MLISLFDDGKKYNVIVGEVVRINGNDIFTKQVTSKAHLMWKYGNAPGMSKKIFDLFHIDSILLLVCYEKRNFKVMISKENFMKNAIEKDYNKGDVQYFLPMLSWFDFDELGVCKKEEYQKKKQTDVISVPIKQKENSQMMLF